MTSLFFVIIRVVPRIYLVPANMQRGDFFILEKYMVIQMLSD